MNEKSRNNLYIYRTIFSFFTLFILVYRKIEQCCCRNLKLFAAQQHYCSIVHRICIMCYVVTIQEFYFLSSKFSGSKVTQLNRIIDSRKQMFVFIFVWWIFFISHYLGMSYIPGFLFCVTLFHMRVAFRKNDIKSHSFKIIQIMQ